MPNDVLQDYSYKLQAFSGLSADQEISLNKITKWVQLDVETPVAFTAGTVTLYYKAYGMSTYKPMVDSNGVSLSVSLVNPKVRIQTLMTRQRDDYLIRLLRVSTPALTIGLMVAFGYFVHAAIQLTFCKLLSLKVELEVKVVFASEDASQSVLGITMMVYGSSSY